MKPQQSALARREIDRRFRESHLTQSLAQPRLGWIRAVRDALGMSQHVLGRRLGVTAAAVSQSEHAELAGGITIGKLREIAEALDCHLVYAIVPNTSLSETVNREATKVALEQLSYVEGTMYLEDQSLPADRRADLLQAQVTTIVDQGRVWTSDRRWRSNG